MENTKGQGNSGQQQRGMGQQQGQTERSRQLDSNSDQQNASANRGGTSDMDSEALGNSSRSANRGSGISTKRSVTGSDYDGQVSQD